MKANSFARFSVIAATSLRLSSQSIPSPRHLCAVPAYCQGSRMNAADAGTLTASQRAQVKRDLAAYRAANPVPVALTATA